VKKILSNRSITRTEKEKQQIIKKAAKAYAKFMDALGFDWQNDPNAAETPMRVAKAWVNDIASGCFNEAPKITAFENIDHYDGMVFQGNIKVHSLCAHHHIPFFGYAYVAYIPDKQGKVIGLSKINRIVNYYSRRPQVQENLTMQIHDHISKICEGNLGVAVYISAEHMCVKLRGVKHDSTMKTSKLSGVFINDNVSCRYEFYNFIADLQRGRN